MGKNEVLSKTDKSRFFSIYCTSSFHVKNLLGDVRHNAHEMELHKQKIAKLLLDFSFL